MLGSTALFANTDSTDTTENIEKRKDGTLGDMFSCEDRGRRVCKEWEKLRIRFDGKLLEESFSLGDNTGIGLGLKYRYLVQPAFVRNLHQRFDIYTASGSLGYSLGEGFGLGGGLNAIVTFSRLYENKTDALKARVYFLNRIPWTAKGVEEELDEGDAVRIEIHTSGSLGKGITESTQKYVSGASASVSRTSVFMADIYKMKQGRVRVRMIGSRNSASFGVNFSINPVNKLIDTGVSLLDRLGNRWFKFRPANLGFSTNPFESMPIDTFMSDYVFDMNKPEGAKAYEEILANLRKLKFLLELNFLANETKLGEALERHIVPAERQFLEKDRFLRASDRSVDRVFKGRTSSSNTSLNGESSLSKLWTLQGSIYFATTNVVSYRPDNSTSLMVFTSRNSNFKKEGPFNLYGNEITYSINGLFDAVRVKSGSNQEFAVKDISDLLLTRDYQDKRLTSSDINRAKEYVKDNLPDIAPIIDWGQLNEIKKSTNGYIRMSFLFHAEALSYLSRFSPPELYARLADYIYKHPDVMQFKAHAGKIGDESSEQALEREIQNLHYELLKVFRSENAGTRLSSFQALKNSPLFQEVAMGFISSLLPKENLRKLIFFRLVAGADEVGNLSFTFGENDMSDLYRSLQYILAVINDRSFDLRLQIDERGEFYPYRTKNSETNKCDNCDAVITYKEGNEL